MELQAHAMAEGVEVAVLQHGARLLVELRRLAGRVERLGGALEEVPAGIPVGTLAIGRAGAIGVRLLTRFRKHRSDTVRPKVFGTQTPGSGFGSPAGEFIGHGSPVTAIARR